jgi:hypothetical protein
MRCCRTDTQGSVLAPYRSQIRSRSTWRVARRAWYWRSSTWQGAAFDRCLGVERCVNVLFEGWVLAAQLVERQLRERDFAGERALHEPARDVMGVSKRDALGCEVVRKLGRVHEAFGERAAHARSIEARGRERSCENLQTCVDGVECVEHRRLVFLHVAVVREWQALEHHQQVYERAHHAPALAAHELGHVRVFLLRHHRGAGGERVAHLHEAELLGAPQYELFCDARHVDRAVGERRDCLDQEVAVGHGVERVAGDAAEAELGGGHLSIERKRRAGERARSERRDVQAPRRIFEPRAIALEHLAVREQVVGEAHGLRALQVCVARQEHVHRALGAAHEHAQKLVDQAARAHARFARVQAHVGRDLIVSAAACVQARARVADALGQRRLDVHVDVFARRVPAQLATLDLAADLL